MVHIVFDVEFCRDDCPFCDLDKETGLWFCARLYGEPIGYNVVEDMNTRPLKNCPFK